MEIVAKRQLNATVINAIVASICPSSACLRIVAELSTGTNATHCARAKSVNPMNWLKTAGIRTIKLTNVR